MLAIACSMSATVHTHDCDKRPTIRQMYGQPSWFVRTFRMLTCAWIAVVPQVLLLFFQILLPIFQIQLLILLCDKEFIDGK